MADTLRRVLGGVSTAMGDNLQQLQQRNEEADARKQEWSDERRRATIGQYMGVANNLQKSLALLLNPDTMQPMPGKEQQVAQIRQQLGEVDSYIRNLYNPSFNLDTGKVYEDPLHKLAVKLHLAKPPAQNATAGEQIRALRAIQERYGELPPSIDTAEQHRTREQEIEWTRQELKKYGASDDVIKGVTAAMLGSYKPTAPKQQWDLLQGTANGKQVSWLKDKHSGEITDLAGDPVPSDLLQAFAPNPKPETASQLTMDAYQNAFDPPIKWADMTPEQKAFYPRWKAMQGEAVTQGQHVVMVPQKDGTIKPVTIETTSQKSYPSAGAPPGLRKPKKEKTPGQQIRDLAAIRDRHSRGAGVVSVGDAVGGRETPEEKELRMAAQEGELRLADAETANRDHNNANDLIILENFLQMAFGIQPRGIRGSPAWFENVKQIAGGSWWDRMQGEMARISGGGLLSDDAREQLMTAIRNTVQNRQNAVQGMGESTSGRKPLSSFGR
jgi:hypothetical protein